MGRNVQVTEKQIREAAEQELAAAGGNLAKVTGRRVQAKVGGGNDRVREIVAAWKAEKKEAPEPSTAVTASPLPVPPALTEIIGRAVATLEEIGPVVTELTEAAIREERRRSDLALASERQTCEAMLAQKDEELGIAQEDEAAYGRNLDAANARIEELESTVETLKQEAGDQRSKATDYQRRFEEAQLQLSSERGRADQAETREQEGRARYERSEGARANLEKSFADLSAAHDRTLRDEREAHRQELDKLQARHDRSIADAEKRIEQYMNRLDRANHLIDTLRERLTWSDEGVAEPEDGPGTTPPDDGGKA